MDDIECQEILEIIRKYSHLKDLKSEITAFDEYSENHPFMAITYEECGSKYCKIKKEHLELLNLSTKLIGIAELFMKEKFPHKQTFEEFMSGKRNFKNP